MPVFSNPSAEALEPSLLDWPRGTLDTSLPNVKAPIPVPRPPQFNWRCILCQTIPWLTMTYDQIADGLNEDANIAEEMGNTGLADALRNAAREWEQAAEEGRQAFASGNCGHPEECGI